MGFNIGGPSAKDLCNAGFEFEPLFPGTLQGIGARITVYGPESDALKQHQVGVEEEVRQEANARRPAKSVEEQVALVNKRMVDQAVALTRSWDDMTKEGQPLPCTPQNAGVLYRAHPWIRDQVLEKGGNLANFIRPSVVANAAAEAVGPVEIQP